MQQQDTKKLLENYLAGKCTAEEQAALETWYLNYTEQNLPALTLTQLHEIENSVPYIIKPDRPTVKLWSRIAAAAAVLLFAILGVYFAFYKAGPPLLANQHISPSIKPGTNTAILTLAGGKKIILNNAKLGTMANQGNSIVAKTAEGQLTYNTDRETQNERPPLNTIETPRGGQYEVTLSDGTKVWLNAASSLTYPTVFTGKERRVELHGEGYFEVAKNKAMPFIVASPNQQVEVLGTHFDISAYNDDEGVFRTTLLEGSVRLNEKTILVPGEQGINANSKMTVKQVDTENSIAWKNGKFTFENENIKDLMRKVARWYNVEVFYEGEMTRKDFSGSVSRFDSISKILNILESTNTIHFKIEGRRITVMP